MPERDTAPAATWSLPEINHIQISYQTHDRFEASFLGIDPHEAVAQQVQGVVVGKVDNHGECGRSAEIEVPLGMIEGVSKLPILYKLANTRTFEDTLVQHSDWTSPAAKTS